mmetsp:Transcript_37979/g.118504  ORF Transcript_37979/g.118504 Transcript_37979/m.118504 type:complete len:253 (-) Transcript_37979:118-876(-)
MVTFAGSFSLSCSGCSRPSTNTLDVGGMSPPRVHRSMDTSEPWGTMTFSVLLDAKYFLALDFWHSTSTMRSVSSVASVLTSHGSSSSAPSPGSASQRSVVRGGILSVPLMAYFARCSTKCRPRAISPCTVRRAASRTAGSASTSGACLASASLSTSSNTEATPKSATAASSRAWVCACNAVGTRWTLKSVNSLSASSLRRAKRASTVEPTGQSSLMRPSKVWICNSCCLLDDPLEAVMGSPVRSSRMRWLAS